MGDSLPTSCDTLGPPLVFPGHGHRGLADKGGTDRRPEPRGLRAQPRGGQGHRSYYRFHHRAWTSPTKANPGPRIVSRQAGGCTSLPPRRHFLQAEGVRSARARPEAQGRPPSARDPEFQPPPPARAFPGATWPPGSSRYSGGGEGGALWLSRGVHSGSAKPLWFHWSWKRGQFKVRGCHVTALRQSWGSGAGNPCRPRQLPALEGKWRRGAQNACGLLPGTGRTLSAGSCGEGLLGLPVGGHFRAPSSPLRHARPCPALSRAAALTEVKCRF